MSSGNSPSGERRAFAAGDFLTRYAQPSEFSFLIESPFRKPGWTSRTFSPTGVVFPGSAISFEERYFEIYSIQATSKYINYYLKPWEDRFPLRVQFLYTTEECVRLARERKKDKVQQRAQAVVLLLAPFAGLLPEKDQYRLQNSLGIQARTLTQISAICCLFPGGASFLFLLVQLIGGETIEPASHYKTVLYLAGCYLLLECFVRIYTAMKLEEPMGSLFAWLPIEAIRAARGTGNKKEKPPAQIEKKIAVPPDEIRKTNHESYDLEVISVLPKPSWNVFTGIHYGEQWFGLVETKTSRENGEIRHHFFLKEAPPGFCFRTTCDYNEKQVQMLHRNQEIANRSTWVWTFPWLWGFLPEKDQDRLTDLYDFDAMKFTRITFIALGLLGFFNLAAAIMNAVFHRFNSVDAIVLVPSMYLLIESVHRWFLWQAGRPSGSVLGWLARPFAKKLLE